MSQAIDSSTVDKKRTIPQDFDYIEGTIKEFPAVLRSQIDSYDGSDFAACRWVSRGRDRQSLTQSMNGRQVKFVMRDDSDGAELPAGRFWYSSKQQIVVVGLPNKNATDPVRHVVVRYTRSKGRFVSPDGWKGTHWEVWRPGKKNSHYYEGIPEHILRLQAPKTPPEDGEDEEADATTANETSRVTQEQTPDHMTPSPDHSKRRSSLPAATSKPPKRKRLDEGESMSSPAHDKAHGLTRSGAKEIQPPREPRSNDLSSTPQPQKFEYSSDTSEDTDTIPAVVKQEAPHTNTDDAAAEASDVPGYSLVLDTTVKEQDDESTTALPDLVSSPVATSSVNGHRAVIDLTTEREKDAQQTVPRHYPNIVFVDERGQTQRQMRFDKCDTAKDLFEEACTWDVANRETNMLEVKITGCKPARIRKYNQDHFEEKILRPLRTMMANRTEGQVITLVVRKYM